MDVSLPVCNLFKSPLFTDTEEMIKAFHKCVLHQTSRQSYRTARIRESTDITTHKLNKMRSIVWGKELYVIYNRLESYLINEDASTPRIFPAAAFIKAALVVELY